MVFYHSPSLRCMQLYPCPPTSHISNNFMYIYIYTLALNILLTSKNFFSLLDSVDNVFVIVFCLPCSNPHVLALKKKDSNFDPKKKTTVNRFQRNL